MRSPSGCSRRCPGSTCETYFPESTRRDITQMVGHIKDEFTQRLRTNPWLDEPTRAAALDKLARVDIQVGYPQQWIDFSPIVIRPDDHFGNVQRVSEFQQRRDLAKLGQPVVAERFASPPYTSADGGERRLRPADQQHRHHGRHRAAAVLRARRRCGGELLHHRRGHRPRADARLRQQRQPLRAGRQPAQLVDAAGDSRIQEAHRRAGDSSTASSRCCRA